MAVAQFDRNGRIVIPAEYRKALGVGPGQDVIVKLIDGQVVIMTPEDAMKRIHEMVAKYIPLGTPLSEELMAERKIEAERE